MAIKFQLFRAFFDELFESVRGHRSVCTIQVDNGGFAFAQVLEALIGDQFAARQVQTCQALKAGQLS